MSSSFFFLILFFFPTLNLYQPGSASPLSTKGRWIVNGAGHRVKLACINWPGHVDAMVVEGLSKQPVDVISNKISSLGFNCVRLTFANYMLTNQSYTNLTVRKSLVSNGLNESAAAVGVLNPRIVDLSLLDGLKAVVKSLEKHKIMVILDNHVSKPKWCCDKGDGNGFFGDKYFDPNEWVEGLTKMARAFNGASNVVGMSLRNELRGPRQNVPDWYKYMQMGAEAVHKTNKHMLIILSGLRSATDLSFLQKKPIKLTFKSKLVYELHWYSFTNPGEWLTGDLNRVCSDITSGVMQKAGFLLNRGFPLFMSEFGIDQRGESTADNRYLGCILAAAAELDLDWALWALQGSYYRNQGKLGMKEAYSVLSYDWVNTRNESLMRMISSIQLPFRGPGLAKRPEHKILYHPMTGQCAVPSSSGEPVALGPCLNPQAWSYANQELSLMNSASCLRAHGAGKPAEIRGVCRGRNTRWRTVSASKMQFSSELSSRNRSLCLDVGSDGRTLVTNPCKCLTGGSSQCDPERQWFKLVNSTRRSISSSGQLP